VGSTNNNDLGRMVSMHGIPPAFLQRAVFIVLLSFVFFLAMMLVYYLRQSLVYFLLASAFLVLYIITMFSWVLMRRSVISVYENGLIYRGRTIPWSQIDTVEPDGTITTRTGKPVVIPSTLQDRARLLEAIKARTQRQSAV
jgi:hypothetical protein